MSGLGTALGLTAIGNLPQKLAMGGLTAALVGMGIFTGTQLIENHHKGTQIAGLQASIDDPRTGYRAIIATARANAGNLQAAVDRQTAALKQQGAQDAARIAAVQARYDSEHAARLVAERRVAVFLSIKPQGATLDARVRDIDARILGELK